MKKNIILILFILIILSGCKNKTSSFISSNTIIITSNEYNKLKSIVKDIKSQIVIEFNKDLSLPTYINNKYSLEYEALGGEIIDGYLIYTSSPNDYNITLKIIVSSSSLEYSEYLTIKNLADPNYLENYQINKLNIELNNINTQIPSLISKDLSLIELIDYDESSYSIKYYLNNVETIDPSIIYEFNETDEIITLKIELSDLYSHTLSFTKELVILSVDKINNVPRMYLTYDETKEITKDEYIDATMSYYIKENNEYKAVYENKTLGIRGRGNSTYNLPKRPYKLKFDNKISFFGSDKYKKWVLLANYIDQSLLRNYLAYNFAKSLSNLSFSPSANYVELYINNEYNGLYLLCDQIEAKEGRVDISEEETSDINTNYLLEINNKLFDYPEGTLNKDYFIINYDNTSQAIEIKTPDPDENYFSTNQLEYIKSYLLEVLNVLKNKGDIYKYIDINSAVDYFIVEEIFKNCDSGYSSTYLYKKKDGLLYFGPVWDFDLSAGNPGHLDEENRSYKGFYTSLKYRHIFYYYLMQDERFLKALKSRWKELFNNEIKDLLENIDITYEYIKGAAYFNFKRWDIIGKDYSWYTTSETYETLTYQGQINILKIFLNKRIKWLNKELS